MKYLIIMGTFILFACQGGTKEQKQADKPVLNQGKKWKVNQEMLPHLRASQALLEAYLKESGSDYRELAKGMKAHTDALIKSCTMQGADHDALHTWLHPHMELLEKLEHSGSQAEAGKTIAELKTSFSAFDESFE